MLQGKLEKDRRIGDWDVDFIFFLICYIVIYVSPMKHSNYLRIWRFKIFKQFGHFWFNDTTGCSVNDLNDLINCIYYVGLRTKYAI